jgi:hypothetical protein
MYATRHARRVPRLNRCTGMVSLLFGWEAFIPLQIIGFVVLSFGAFTFGEAISFRSCFPSLYPPIVPRSEAEEPLINRWLPAPQMFPHPLLTSPYSNSEPATPSPGVKISMAGWASTSEISNRSNQQDL